MKPLIVLPIALLVLLLAGCDSGALGPAEVFDTPSAPPPTVPGSQATALGIAVEDVIVRVLPVIGESAEVADLETHLAALAAALKAGDAALLAAPLAAAQEAVRQLGTTPEAVAEYGADLAAVELVLDFVAVLRQHEAPRPEAR